ncbi:MAG TPA: hypothetical protein VHE30_25090 [Polyangiaceae bacterium]|nr:hypothetical protein [Polyangiaceae bacterium]
MRKLALLPITLGALLASTAHADPVPSLDLRSFHPPAHSKGFLYTEPSTTPGAGNWDLGAYASYALSPVVLDDANGNRLARVVAHQVSMDYFAALGLGESWAVSLAVPTIVYQTGDDVRGILPDSESLRHTTIGAVSVGVKKTLVAPSDLGGLGVALLGRADVPTDARSYASDRAFGGELRALGELDLLAVAVRATAGFHLRGKNETFLRDGTDDYRFGSDVPWGAGITLRPQALGIDRAGRFRWTAEVRGALGTTPAFGRAPQSPALAGLSARYTVGEVSGILGVELPLTSAVGDPVVRPVLGVSWAPRFEDADQDGIEDEKDECPELAEDRDGFEDQDGCPDFDDDDDGVPDDQDKCPKSKEDADGFQDDDGCDDPDNDGDGVPDAADQCPNDKGPANGPKPGCVDPDPDHDGVLLDKDRCPNEPEDRDGWQDADGCPDPDDDGDGVPDAVDACRREKGEPSAAPELNGCKILDHDGDSFDDVDDRCPKEAEDFDGVEDEDGCPEEKAGKPLVVVQDAKDGKVVSFRTPLTFVKDEVTGKSVPRLRALSAELNRHPDWIAVAGVQPAGTTPRAEQAALNRAFSIVLALRFYTHRDAAAETVAWSAVADAPGAKASGVGVIVLAPPTLAAPAAPSATPSPPPAPGEP